MSVQRIVVVETVVEASGDSSKYDIPSWSLVFGCRISKWNVTSLTISGPISLIPSNTKPLFLRLWSFLRFFIASFCFVFFSYLPASSPRSCACQREWILFLYYAAAPSQSWLSFALQNCLAANDLCFLRCTRADWYLFVAERVCILYVRHAKPMPHVRLQHRWCFFSPLITLYG